ncbi:hypothetical protein TNCV_2956301 [Trichonephila clavipes]|nr:hypothetical protein TNCV_2956301 [Trichonephila clavipes]
MSPKEENGIWGIPLHVPFGPRFAVGMRQEIACSCQPAGDQSLQCHHSVEKHCCRWREACQDEVELTFMDPSIQCLVKGLVLPTLTIDQIAAHSRFLLVTLPNKEMSKKLPFAIHKALIRKEAKKLIASQLSQTYALAAKSLTVNNSTQTDENITKIKCPPLKLLQPLISLPKPNISSIISVSTSSSFTQAQLLPSTSSIEPTMSESQPYIPVFNTPVHSPIKVQEITKIIFEDSSVTYSCGKIQSAMVEVNENNSENRRASLICHKAKKNKTIHAHMSQIQKEERLKRIRRWQQPNTGDSPVHGTLHSSLQLVSGNHYNSSSNISNEQMKQHEAILVDGSFQSSHYNFLPVINPNQIPLPSYNLDHNVFCNFGSNSYYTRENFKLNFRNNVQYFGLATTRRLLETDHVILNNGQVTGTTLELAPPSPNYHTTPT